MLTLAQVLEAHDQQVLDHLDTQVTVPVLTALQAQGDVIVVPAAVAMSRKAKTVLPAAGVPVVRGENGGNTHTLVADGPALFDQKTPTVTDLALGVLTVLDGSTAYLIHPEHGATGIGPGTYEIRRQRQQLEETRLVAD